MKTCSKAPLRLVLSLFLFLRLSPPSAGVNRIRKKSIDANKGERFIRERKPARLKISKNRKVDWMLQIKEANSRMKASSLRSSAKSLLFVYDASDNSATAIKVD